MMNRPPARRPSIILIFLFFMMIFGFHDIKDGFHLTHIPVYMINGTVYFITSIIPKLVLNLLKTDSLPRGFTLGFILIVTIFFVYCIVTGKKLFYEIKGLFHDYKIERKYSNAYKDDCDCIINPDEHLKIYDSEFRDICATIGIDQIVFKYVQSVDIRAVEESRHIPVVEIGQVFLNRLSIIKNKEFQMQFFKYALAHELIHIRYHDPMNLRWTILLGSILWFYGLFIIRSLIVFLNQIPHNISLLICFLVLIFWFFFVPIYFDWSYWSQVWEIRADKEAIAAINGNSEIIFTAFSLCYPEKQIETNVPFRQIVSNLFRLLTSRKKTLEGLSHPSIFRRKTEVLHGKKWNVIDYTRYGFQLRVRQIKGIKS